MLYKRSNILYKISYVGYEISDLLKKISDYSIKYHISLSISEILFNTPDIYILYIRYLI